MLRRNFLQRGALFAASVAGIFAGISIFRIFSKGSGESRQKVRIGYPPDFPVDSYTLIEEYGVFVYRDHEGIKAVSSVCTHLGCTVMRTEEGFECPCHGSCYSDDGEVLSGPAPSALDWYRLEKSADGSLLVDLDSKADAAYKYLYS